MPRAKRRPAAGLQTAPFSDYIRPMRTSPGAKITRPPHHPGWLMKDPPEPRCRPLRRAKTHTCRRNMATPASLSFIAMGQAGHIVGIVNLSTFALQYVGIAPFREDSATDGHGGTQMEWSS